MSAVDQLIARNRELVIAALHSHATVLDDDLFLSKNLPDPNERAAAKTRIVRERADALDLARDLECAP